MANFLGNLIGAPEMGNDMMLPNMSAGIDASLQRNQQLGQMQQQQMQQRPKSGTGGTLRNILGTIGDALLINAGHQPVYAQHRQQQQAQERKARLGQMLGNYLGNSDAALAELFAEDPDTALAVYKMKNAQPEVPGIIREAEAFNRLPPAQRQQAMEYMRLRFPGMSAPITMGANDTVEMPGAPAEQGGDLPTVASPDEARQLPPGSQFRMPDGRIGTVPGGPTATPSATFLDGVTSQSESGNRDFDARGKLIRSSAGALGRMQVMPATARDPGFGVRPASGANPAELARVGREYRAAMQQRYGGDLAKMWAAYNAGPGRVDDAIAQHGSRWLDSLPAETRAYVRKNMGALGG